MIDAGTPILPYFGVYMKDLELIEEGNENYLHGLINWYKMELLGQITRQISIAQRQPFNFRRLGLIATEVFNIIYYFYRLKNLRVK